MTFDCFIYNGEIELLEIRINELSNLRGGVTHVIVEAPHTHTGIKKKLYFPQQKEIHEKYKNIMYLVVGDMPLGSTAMEMEIYQRNKIMQGLEVLEPKDDDIVIIGDVDEIPRAEKIKKFMPSMQFASLMMDKYAYFFNYVESWQSWDRARIMLYGYLKNKKPDEVRNSGYDYIITHAGWHYSWLIDPARKLRSFSHTELNTIENEERINRKENIWSKDKFHLIDINLSHPRYLYENQKKFSHLIAHSL